ncbi:hypothetical protein NCCP2495_30220 [Dietzia sp. NCCP-2495]|uniref:hypothetical protein n=1 Tax=Dietzia sp. NCCP-2495 TaxID=2934675 RepID=UPI00222F802A|nr:hypothetical protein [Dietzia sp. NCCP-2495]GLB65142.1 hypothetical protein NCCP2495_30220 [Dietzia sp. NCCP-2495]
MATDPVETLSTFVRRLRRIEAHPLISTDNGELIRELCSTQMHVTVYPQLNEAVQTFNLPDEVLFESLAARLRPMTLEQDRIGYGRVFDALDRLTGTDDLTTRLSNDHLRSEWTLATRRDRANRGSTTRAYGVIGDGEPVSDLDLAYGWLYEDSLHGDPPSFDQFGLRERYRAATHVFSHIAVVAIETLAYLRHLADEGHLVLPDEAFGADVVVSETTWEIRGEWYVGEPVDGGMSSVSDGEVPAEMRPIQEVYPPNPPADPPECSD